MSESLWAVTTADLLSRTASSDPTPGGGSVAAITGALGVGLVRMAVAVTGDPALSSRDAALAALSERIVAAADADTEQFEALVAAQRLPRADEAEAARRRRAVQGATTTATEGPLALVAALVEVLVLAHEVEPGVKAGVVSDVLAGRDLLVGAARAALRTVDINLRQLDRLAAERATELRGRRDELARQLEEAA